MRPQLAKCYPSLTEETHPLLRIHPGFLFTLKCDGKRCAGQQVLVRALDDLLDLTGLLLSLLLGFYPLQAPDPELSTCLDRAQCGSKHQISKRAPLVSITKAARWSRGRLACLFAFKNPAFFLSYSRFASCYIVLATIASRRDTFSWRLASATDFPATKFLAFVFRYQGRI